jgi:protein phosphatase
MVRLADQAAASDVGRVRKANEDSYLAQPPLFVVADGMGGAQAGEVASGLAVDAFKQPLENDLSPEVRMAGAVRRANHAIHEKSLSGDEFQGMGTTITALLLGDSELTIAHVGDSRAYRLRGGELTRLTRDHSLVGEMVRRGAITEAEAEVHPQRSILTRALGPEDEVEIDTLSHGLQDGDVYLICSDGLTGMVSEAAIAEEMGSGEPLERVADNLIRRANQRGGVDNITVVAFRMEGGPLADQPAAEIDRDGQTISAPAVTPPTPAAPAVPAPAPIPQTAAAGSANGAGRAEREAGSRGAFERRRGATGRSRRWVGGIVAAVVVVLAIGGAIVGSLNVYFIGGNNQGLVTVYRGLPYDLPLSVSLYTRDYVTATPVAELPPGLRAQILDHKLRSRGDALDLARQIDAGRIDAQDVGVDDGSAGPTAGN